MKKLQTIIISRWFWLIAIIVFFLSRMTAALFPYDSDHWIFYYIGRKWLNGSSIYVDMWDHKSPLIYLYNGILDLAFGDNIWIHRIFFSLIALLVLYLFYKTAQLLYETIKLNNEKLISRLTTLLFAFYANLSVFTNSGNNNENIGLIFLIGTLYLYLKYRQNVEKQYLLVLSGLLASFVFVLKANFAIFLLPIAIDLIYINRKNIYRLIGGLAMFAFGTLLHLLVWALYFKTLGTFKQFYIASFEFNGKYIEALGWDWNAPNIMIFIGILILLLLFFIPFLIAALKGFGTASMNTVFLVPLFSVSILIFFIAAGTFYSHYFLIAIPYLCLIFGATAYKVFASYRFSKIITLSVIAGLLFVISLKLGVYNSYVGTPATELKNQKIAANYIINHTSERDKIFANLYGATFYQLVSKDSGSRFISASHPLIDYKHNFGYDFNRKFIFDMIDSEAKYVVMSSDKQDIYRVQNPVLMRFINNNYQLEATAGGYDILIRTSDYK